MLVNNVSFLNWHSPDGSLNHGPLGPSGISRNPYHNITALNSQHYASNYVSSNLFQITMSFVHINLANYDTVFDGQQ